MEPTKEQVEALLHAAEDLLAAREHGMVTAAEWEDLQCAVDDCRGAGSDEEGG